MNPVKARAKVYLAAPLFTPEQQAVVNRIRDAMMRHEIRVFSPLHNSQKIFNGRKPIDCSEEERNQVVQDNIVHIDWCDIILCWVGGMGGFTDPGVVWEMGYATRAKKFVMAYVDETDERKSMNLMLAATIQALVYGQAELEEALPSMRQRWYGKLIFDYPPKMLAHDKIPVV